MIDEGAQFAVGDQVEVRQVRSNGSYHWQPAIVVAVYTHQLAVEIDGERMAIQLRSVRHKGQ